MRDSGYAISKKSFQFALSFVILTLKNLLNPDVVRNTTREADLMAKIFLLLIYPLLIPIFLIANVQEFRFEQITVQQGLSSNEVFCVLKDKNGFMWFGTRDGLNKYDGNEIKVYKHIPGDSTSLNCNMICTLFEDIDGDMWIGTWRGGLNKYIRKSDSFVHFDRESKKPFRLCFNFVTTIFEDSNSNLWVGTINGLSCLVKRTNTIFETSNSITRFNHNISKITNHLPYNYILSINEDRDGLIWISTNDKGITQFDPKKSKFSIYRTIKGLDFDNQSASIIYIDSESTEEKVFVATKDQVFIYNLMTDEVSSYYYPEPTTVQCINKVGEKSYWFGTVGNGIYIFDNEEKKFHNVKAQHEISGSLSNNYVINIYKDLCDRIWVATSGGGINKYDSGKRKFKHYKLVSKYGNALYHNSAIIEDLAEERRILWIGTTDQGLVRYDRITGKIKQYKSILGRINCIYQDTYNLDILWLATDEYGLYRFNKRKEKFSNHRERKIRSDQNKISGRKYSNYWLRSVIGDRTGNLWLGAGGGFFKFDREYFTITPYVHIPGDPKSIRGNSLNTLVEDSSGYIWIGTRNSGLNCFNPETKKFKFYLNNPQDSLSLSSDFINFLYNDKSDQLWVGSINGLNLFDKKSEKFTNFHTKYNLPGENIKGIQEDKNGCMWISTNNGLLKINPKNGSFRHFDDRDGLQGKEFNRWCSHKSRSGEIFFGGENGFNAFYPEEIKDNSYVPPIVFTDFQIFNKSVRFINNSHFNYTDCITLSHDQSVFSFEFAALDFSEPTKNKYAYMMESVDPEWVYSEASRRFATYTQLDPGEYTFRVKGSNNDGVWNEEGRSIRIIIRPPWWKTTWAYAAYLFLFTLTLYTLRTYDKKRQRLKHELELEHLHAEKLEEVDRIKSRFFANISHEFRTPLTLILGPVKQMLSGDFAGNIKDQYQMIIRNGERLLQLINQLLDLSKLESGRMALQVTKTDLCEFIKAIVFSFSSLAETKKITLRFNPTDNNPKGFIDHDKIEKIITNLMSNAFKFTPERGILSVNVKNPNAKIQMSNEIPITNSNLIEITISNTGPGIPPDKQGKIFDRFYQANSTYKKDSEGTGIGLALTKELVELHHGTINVACTGNDPETKTIFTIQIPIEKEQYEHEEIVENSEAAVRRKETGREIFTENTLAGDAGYRIPDTHEQPKSSSRSPASGLQPPLVLVVEDNPDVTTYICSFLNHDYRIVTAISGKDGWDKTLDKYPELIISDVMMPEMDGFELCEKLKSDENTSHIPVILVTAKADLNSRVEGLEYGADDYISKPFEARELQVRVKNLIEQRQRLKEKFSRAIEIKPGEIAATSMDEQFITRLMDIFEDHVSESDFSTEDFAREVGMSRSNLHRKLQALTNQPTHEFLRTLRLKRAAHLLQKSAGTVAEVAYAVGFNNLSHFTKIFREQFGKPPSQYASKNQ